MSVACEQVVSLEEPWVRVEEGCEQRPLWFSSVHTRSVQDTNVRSRQAGRPVPSSGSNTNHSSPRTSTVVVIQAPTHAASSAALAVPDVQAIR